jgi:hypothetical protein
MSTACYDPASQNELITSRIETVPSRIETIPQLSQHQQAAKPHHIVNCP